MTGQRRLLAAAVLSSVLSAAGCLTCGHTVCRPGLEAGPDCPVPLADRQRVYAVLVNGLAVDGPAGLAGLRDELAAQGFTKVYSGEVCHGPVLAAEVRRVHRDDPAARFVVVGFSLGGPVAAQLAEGAAAAGVPVDALVLLDPVGVRSTEVPGVRTLVVRSGGPVGRVEHAEVVYVPTAGHYTLPAHPRTVQAVGRLMAESAARVEHPPAVTPTEVEFADAPPARRPTPPEAFGDPEWLFLEEATGPVGQPLGPVAPPARRTVYGMPWGTGERGP